MSKRARNRAAVNRERKRAEREDPALHFYRTLREAHDAGSPRYPILFQQAGYTCIMTGFDPGVSDDDFR